MKLFLPAGFHGKEQFEKISRFFCSRKIHCPAGIPVIHFQPRYSALFIPLDFRDFVNYNVISNWQSNGVRQKGGYSTMKPLKLLTVCFFLIPMYLFPVVWGNGSNGAYNGGDSAGDYDGKSAPSAAPILEVLIIEGAGYFLDSHADFQRFLNKYEMAELNGADFQEWQAVLDVAISRMKAANDTYYSLKIVAEGTPYNQAVIEMLKEFDYPGFSLGKGLNAGVFLSMNEFLRRGDVTGTYNKIHLETAGILERLADIKKNIEQGVYPDISKLWVLNQKYSDTLFFGQYMAMVFREVL